MSEKERIAHVEYQRRYFDTNCGFFRQSIPAEIEERTREIVGAAKLSPDSRVLDVGTGMGVLIKHFEEFGVAEENVVGCDLSTKMLEEAKQRYPQAQFWQGDVAELPDLGKFDAVFFNACFGNIFDQRRAIEVVCGALKPNGTIIISHPMGNEFVNKLKTDDPQLVLTLMPDRQQLLDWGKQFGLEITRFVDEPQFYLAALEKTGTAS